MLYEDGLITAYILVVSGIFGAVFGSFINCMAYRIAHNESIIKGRSHCATCEHPLGALDLVPVFSYIFLKGRCRYCKEKISPRYMLTEIAMAIAFVTIIAKYDVSAISFRYLFLVCILLGLSLVDLETYEIPDGFIISGIIAWAVTLPFIGVPVADQLKSGLIGAFALGGGMLVLSIIFDKITGKESLGGGDIKLFFMTGLYIGVAVGLFNLIVACFIGIFFVIFMGERRIPFGPAISIAVFISLLVGTDVVNWYLGLFI